MSRVVANNSKPAEASLNDKLNVIREKNVLLENRHREIELDRKSAIKNGSSIMPSQIRVTIYSENDELTQDNRTNSKGFKPFFRKSQQQPKRGQIGKQYSTSMSRLPQDPGDCGVDKHAQQQNPRAGQNLRGSRRRGGGPPRVSFQENASQPTNGDGGPPVRHIFISEPNQSLPSPYGQPQIRSAHHNGNSRGYLNNNDNSRNSPGGHNRTAQNGYRQDFQDIAPRHYSNNDPRNRCVNSAKSMSYLDKIDYADGGSYTSGFYATPRPVPRSNQPIWKPRRGGRNSYNDGHADNPCSFNQSHSKRQYQVPPRFRNGIQQPHSLINNYYQHSPPFRSPPDEAFTNRDELHNNAPSRRTNQPQSSLRINSSASVRADESSLAGACTPTREPTAPWARGNVICSKDAKCDPTVSSPSSAGKLVKTSTQGTSTSSQLDKPTGRISTGELPNENDFLILDDEYIDDNILDDLDQFTLKIDMDGFVVHDPSICHPMLSKPISSWIDDEVDYTNNGVVIEEAKEYTDCQKPLRLPECSPSSGISTLSSRRMSTGDLPSTVLPLFPMRQTSSLDCIDKLLISSKLKAALEPDYPKCELEPLHR